MITPEFIAKFKADHGLTDLRLAREDFEDIAEQRAEIAAKWMADHTPVRYADATPTHPQIQAWSAAVLTAAADGLGKAISAAISTGPSLLILGGTGTGKTYEAYGAVRLISAVGLHCKWRVVSAADLYAKLRPRHGVDSETEFQTYAEASLLVVDDLGAAKTSEWVEEVNFRLVNYRYDRKLPTLFTSNIPPAALREALGERVSSRLTEMTTRVAIAGQDRRRAA